MSDTLVVVAGGGSSQGGTGTPPPVPSLASLIVPDALSDLRALLLRDEARQTLIGISAIKALLLAELVEHVKVICVDHKRLVDYVAPAVGNPVPPATPASGGASADGSAGGPVSAADTASHAAAAEPAPSQFVVDLGKRMAAVVTMPVEQLRTTVESQGKTIDSQGKAIDSQGKTIDSQGKAIDKGAAGISELQVARTAGDARLTGLEANFSRLEVAHRGLSNRVADMDIELGESEDATEALGEAVREAGSQVFVVVEEGENRGESGRKTRARPMRQAATNVRKAQARKKK